MTSVSLSHLRAIQDWLRTSALAGLVIPSTDEFISEFAPPANRRLRWATGFRGSTGTAVVLRDAAALFLDGRYALQGAADTAGTGISVEATTMPVRREWLKRLLPPGARIGIDPGLHAVPDFAQWQSLAAELGFAIESVHPHPIDALWTDARPPAYTPPIVDYPIEYAGETHESKCAALREHIRAAGLQALLVADPEDVSWLLNVRTARDVLQTEVGEWHVVPSCTSSVLFERDGRVRWFIEPERLTAEVRARGHEVCAPDTLKAVLRESARQGPIELDPNRTPATLALVIEEVGKVVADDSVARRRWSKHPAEVLGAKRAHILDAVAVVRFMAWLTNTVSQRTITEFQAAQQLQALRSEHPDFHGPSMPLMSASGPNAAQPHYVPTRNPCRRLNDHPIYWMDSGGQYFGGSTDNTLTLALDTPEPKHVLAHTLVLQGYIALATTRFPFGTTGVRLDPIARQALWREGMDFAHSTGHGVGNYLNIHEGPLLGRELLPTSTIALEPGMIVTNEPAYYAPGDFGLRIESHMVVVPARHPGFLEFETISRLPIDPRLVDFARLTSAERQWLATYHHTVQKDIEPLLDVSTAAWLAEIVRAFESAAAA